MTTGKKIIKYLSMAFAIFLTFTIISGITNGIYSLISVFRDSSGNGDVRVLWNNDNTNIDDIDIDALAQSLEKNRNGGAYSVKQLKEYIISLTKVEKFKDLIPEIKPEVMQTFKRQIEYVKHL